MDKAKQVLERALPIYEKQYGCDHINVANILVSLGNVYRVLGDQHNAKEVFERALPIIEKQYGCDPVSYTHLMFPLAIQQAVAYIADQRVTGDVYKRQVLIT